MNKFFNAISNLLKTLTARFAPKARASERPVCGFCGRPGHDTEDCPDSAKFKVFSVDHDSEPDR